MYKKFDIEKVITDTDRLNWMVENEAYVYRINWDDGTLKFYGVNGISINQFLSGQTPREAIDNAMKG